MNTEAIHGLQLPSSTGTIESDVAPCNVNRRLLAFALDSVGLSACIFVAATISWMIAGAAISFDFTQPGPDNGLLADPSLVRLTTYVSTLVSLCYFVGSWMLMGATPGQKLLGVRVQGAGTKTRLTISQALTRWVLLGAPLWILSTAMPDEIGALLTVASVAWSAFLLISTIRSARGQGPHDRWAGSMVTDMSYAMKRPALQLVKTDVR